MLVRLLVAALVASAMSLACHQPGQLSDLSDEYLETRQLYFRKSGALLEVLRCPPGTKVPNAGYRDFVDELCWVEQDMPWSTFEAYIGMSYLIPGADMTPEELKQMRIYFTKGDERYPEDEVFAERFRLGQLQRDELLEQLRMEIATIQDFEATGYAADHGRRQEFESKIAKIEERLLSHDASQRLRSEIIPSWNALVGKMLEDFASRDRLVIRVDRSERNSILLERLLFGAGAMHPWSTHLELLPGGYELDNAELTAEHNYIQRTVNCVTKHEDKIAVLVNHNESKVRDGRETHSFIYVARYVGGEVVDEIHSRRIDDFFKFSSCTFSSDGRYVIGIAGERLVRYDHAANELSYSNAEFLDRMDVISNSLNPEEVLLQYNDPNIPRYFNFKRNRFGEFLVSRQGGVPRRIINAGENRNGTWLSYYTGAYGESSIESSTERPSGSYLGSGVVLGLSRDAEYLLNVDQGRYVVYRKRGDEMERAVIADAELGGFAQGFRVQDFTEVEGGVRFAIRWDMNVNEALSGQRTSIHEWMDGETRPTYLASYAMFGERTLLLGEDIFAYGESSARLLYFRHKAGRVYETSKWRRENPLGVSSSRGGYIFPNGGQAHE